MKKLKQINPLYYQIPCLIIAGAIIFFGMYLKCDTTLVLGSAALILVAGFGSKMKNAIGLGK